MAYIKTLRAFNRVKPLLEPLVTSDSYTLNANDYNITAKSLGYKISSALAYALNNNIVPFNRMDAIISIKENLVTVSLRKPLNVQIHDTKIIVDHTILYLTNALLFLNENKNRYNVFQLPNLKLSEAEREIINLFAKNHGMEVVSYENGYEISKKK